MTAEVIDILKGKKPSEPDKKKPEPDPARRFEGQIKRSGELGFLAALLRGGIEEEPTDQDRAMVEEMKKKTIDAKLSADKSQEILAYLGAAEAKGNRGAMSRAWQMVKLHLQGCETYGMRKVLETELRFMGAYAEDRIETLAAEVIRMLWGKTDRVSRMWHKVISKALYVEVPAQCPHRRESAIFYVLRDYLYTTYPNSTSHLSEDELCDKIEGRIEILEAW